MRTILSHEGVQGRGRDYLEMSSAIYVQEAPISKSGDLMQDAKLKT